MTHASELASIALRYSRELDECTQTGGANIDRVMELIAPDAVHLVDGRAPACVGAAAIRDSYLHRASMITQEVELHSVDVWGDLVVCRAARRDSGMARVGVEHHLRVLLVKGDKVQRVLVVTDPEEDALLRTPMGSGG